MTHSKSTIRTHPLNEQLSLREKCPNTELFLVRIWTLFTQCAEVAQT